MRRQLCKFNGVSVMRKTRGISAGTDQSTGRSALIVVCVRKLQARSLVGDNESAPRLQVRGSTERARSEWVFHGAVPTRKGGERSWIWAAVSLSMTTIGPPHWGQSQSGFDCLASAAVGLDCDGCSAPSSGKQSGRRAARRRLARKPKWRMRTKPLGSVCNRKRRRNSSSARLINLCSLW